MNVGIMHNTGRLSGLPYSLLSQAIHHLTRAELEDLAQSLIDHMDGIDPDPDLEDDDPSGQCDEDELNTGSRLFVQHGRIQQGPGCVISDDDFDEGRIVARYGIDQTEPLPTKYCN